MIFEVKSPPWRRFYFENGVSFVFFHWILTFWKGLGKQAKLQPQRKKEFYFLPKNGSYHNFFFNGSKLKSFDINYTLHGYIITPRGFVEIRRRKIFLGANIFWPHFLVTKSNMLLLFYSGVTIYLHPT